ncbi:MAG: thioredoxin-disulfide reductase [Candidatus Pacebacteria bacterium]|jgi:thioredoxin reductase (NADPH)|nr:thioredoxin-disulfide reductase [Candidatus Paceibacterota bacterium]MDD5535323.1 thioredoxin-disulfide reductase [Candidatus Paceibacterota bacterium]
MNIQDLIIIGGGPAGLTAGIYAGRAKLKTLLFTGSPPGGQLILSEIIDDFPGFPEKLSGKELLEKITAQTKKFGIEVIEQNVVSVDFQKKPFVIKTNNKNEYLAKSVIVATGASNKWLGLEREKELIGRGISVCAVCDGFFFKDKIVAVAGGGDSAMETAVTLTKYAQKVFIIHRRDEFKAAKGLQEEVLNNPKIEIIWNTIITEIQGDQFLKGIIIEDVNTKEKKLLNLDGLFLAIGYKATVDFLQGQLELNKDGSIKVIDNTKTSVDGVFAAGDVCDFKYKQAITAAGCGAMALLDVDKWLREQDK